MQTIATMPLNPRHAQKLGFYSLFAYAQYLGKLHQLPTVFAINEVGVKDACASKNLLCGGLKVLGSQPDILWNDTQASEEMLGRLVGQLQENNLLDEVEGNISHCDCMKVQYLPQALLRKTKTSLISQDGTARCCNSLIHEKKAYVLTTRPLEPPKTYPKLYPIWAKKEFDWIYSEIKGQQLLLSRMNDRRFLVTTQSGRAFWLDNDVVGMFLPGLLEQDDVQVNHFVSGVSTMRQVALMMMMSLSLGMELPEQVHFLPRVDFTSRTDTDVVTSAVKEFGIQRVNNALLWCAMSGRQTISLDKSMFLRMLNREIEITSDIIKTRRNLLVR